jgi:hypothetical protein
LTCVKLPSARPPTVGAVLGRGIPMLDIILVALGLGFFAATIAYSYACDRL